MSFEFALLWMIFVAGLVVGTMLFLNWLHTARAVLRKIANLSFETIAVIWLFASSGGVVGVAFLLTWLSERALDRKTQWSSP